MNKWIPFILLMCLTGVVRSAGIDRRDSKSESILTNQSQTAQLYLLRREEAQLVREIHVAAADVDKLKREIAAIDVIKEQTANERIRLSEDESKVNDELKKTAKNRSAQELTMMQRAAKQSEGWRDGIILSIVISLFTFLVWYLLARLRNSYRLKINAVSVELKNVQQKLMDKELLAARGEVTAGVAHEIRNPLNFINNFSDVSKELIDEYLKTAEFDGRKELLESIRDNIEKVNVHGKRAATIITGMKNQNHGKVILNICDLLHESVVLGTYNNQVKPFKVIEEFDPKAKLIQGNRSELQRVFLNLVSNSVYALNKKTESSPDDWKPELKIKVSRVADHVSITISDNGPGIPAQVSKRLFTPFYTTKPAGEGTGLGLSMSKEIIEEHKGKISLNSVEGSGTAFYIMLPVNTGNEAERD